MILRLLVLAGLVPWSAWFGLARALNCALAVFCFIAGPDQDWPLLSSSTVYPCADLALEDLGADRVSDISSLALMIHVYLYMCVSMRRALLHMIAFAHAHGPSMHNAIRFTLFHSVPLLAGKLIPDVEAV